MKTVHVCAESPLLKIVTEILYDYKIVPSSIDQLNNDNFINNNTIVFGDGELKQKFKKNFFLKNNAIFFIQNIKESIENSEFQNENFFYGRLGVKKFVDEIKTCFITKKVVLKKLKY